MRALRILLKMSGHAYIISESVQTVNTVADLRRKPATKRKNFERQYRAGTKDFFARVPG